MGRRSFSDVATELRRSIEDGTYQRFERLPASRNLAEELGVARNTLRDALYQLEKEGLLETRPGSGTYVLATQKEVVPAAVEEATPLELIDARFALEPHICRLCVLHGRREDFEMLDALCNRMEASENEPVAFAEADTIFHRRLAEAIRISPEYAPRLGPIAGRAALAMRLVSGCEVTQVRGDAAQITGLLDCGDGPPPPELLAGFDYECYAESRYVRPDDVDPFLDYRCEAVLY